MSRSSSQVSSIAQYRKKCLTLTLQYSSSNASVDPTSNGINPTMTSDNETLRQPPPASEPLSTSHLLPSIPDPISLSYSPSHKSKAIRPCTTSNSRGDPASSNGRLASVPPPNLQSGDSQSHGHASDTIQNNRLRRTDGCFSSLV